MPRASHPSRQLLRLAGAILVLLSLLPAVAGPVAAAEDGLTMTARALLQGHVRSGSWFAVAVDLANAGPTVNGELRITGGADSRTRFSTPVELATGSRKQYLLYALPPSFGGNMKVQLVDGESVLAEAPVAVASHDQQQLVVGVVAENPARIVGELDLPANQNSVAPVIATLTPADLPERIQAWSAIDRLIWQDTDAAALTSGQLAALRTWIAGGGKLVIVGGTAGADSLAGFPDDLLPYRPTTQLDVDPASLRPVIGAPPEGATPVTAYAGDQGAGRVLATSGDRVIAAELTYGAGSVTLLGFDPTTSWIAVGDEIDAPMWTKLLPQRSGGTVSLSDDSQIVGAVANLPSLALPPITGLLVLLLGYIILVGPVNYLILSRLDRREWAWITVPVLIGVFTIGAFGIGALLRGSDVIVHQVAIVRGAPGTDQATAQTYLGIFSPTRATFQLRVDGDSLLATPMNGDVFGGGTGAGLDVLEGTPSRVRDLEVGFGSLRTVRAEGSATGPIVEAALQLSDGRITGTVTNRSDRALESPALVLGSAAAKLEDIPAGATVDVNFPVTTNPNMGFPLSEKVVGPMSFDGSSLNEGEQRRLVRRSIIDQLSFDPVTGAQFSLPGDSIQLLAWGTDPVLPATIEGQQVQEVANVLYQVPLAFTIGGTTTFTNDLLRASVVDTDSAFFSRDPWSIQLGTGDARMSWRPLPFDGTFGAEKVVVAMSQGGDLAMPGGKPVVATQATRCDPATDLNCVFPQDGLPDIEVLDVETGDWVQFEHLTAGRAYELPEPTRWVDPTSGEVQVRFVNERPDPVYFQFPVAITGSVR